jgi:hypothetical protein
LAISFLLVAADAYSACTSTITNSANVSSQFTSSAANQCLINTGVITIPNDYGIVTGYINSNISNSGTILTSASGGGFYIGGSGNTSLTISNSGTISASDAGNIVYAIWVLNNVGTIQEINNSGLISVTNAAQAAGVAIYDGNIVRNLINSGTVNVGSSGYAGLWVNGGSTVENLLNSGTITAVGISGILNNFSSINTLTNLGVITSNEAGIRNNGGVISTLNNLQGISNASSALTYTGTLPGQYNVIINNSNFGQLSGASITGATNFGIYAGSLITSRLYTGVLQGLADSNVGVTRTGTYDGMVWTLAIASGTSWDLTFTGASTTGTQSSLHSLAYKLRGAFSSQAIATNFANMNTYDCDLFDAKGVCVSVGGQQTYVDNPDFNVTSSVVVAGYKVSPQIRIGGFLNQNINNNTVSGVRISNRNPLMGLFAVWNQQEDRLGFQIKVANAYQDKDVTTTRDVVGLSEAGTGKTDLNTQSYVGELSYAFLAYEGKTLVRPFAAIRNTRIKQDGYTEETSAGVTAPLTYAALADRSTTALVGVKLNHKLAEKVNLTGSLGIEQDLHHQVDNLTATGVLGLTSENFNDNIKRTRPVASIGAYYMPVKNQRIAADLYYQQLPFQSTAATTAYVNYTIGF